MNFQRKKAFAAVALIDMRPIQIVVIPIKWIKDLGLVNYMNKGGAAKYQPLTVFYSVNRTRRANFNLPICRATPFNTNVHAQCYRAKLRKSFGKNIFIST